MARLRDCKICKQDQATDGGAVGKVADVTLWMISGWVVPLTRRGQFADPRNQFPCAQNRMLSSVLGEPRSGPWGICLP
jgi:hypothetical protein